MSKVLYNLLRNERTNETLKSAQSSFEKLDVYSQFNKGMLEKIAGLDTKLINVLLNHQP